MYVCRSCLRKASTSLPRQPLVAPNTTAPWRTFATTSFLLQDKDHDWAKFKTAAKRQVKDMPADDRKDFKRKVQERMKRATKIELQYANDPYHIAENVVTKLKRGEFEKALVLTREASRDKQCVVSWNHLIEYEFKKFRLHSAMKLYNEMKKRAQLPNAQTFTIIFKGCAISQHPTVALGEAVKIYNAMLSSSRLKPNVIHMNAILDVCARAQDLETMFVILRSADKLRAPNNLTYTIILNAMRYQKSNYVDIDDSRKQKVEDIRKNIETTIQRAKLVWDEVMGRWKKGEIIMDEELLCAMGRVLLLGGPKQIDTVLALTADILGIPRLDQELPAAPKKADSEEPKAEVRPARRGPQEKQLQGPSKPIAGNNTLSLIMGILRKYRMTKLASKYWDHLTGRFDIVPDRKNYLDYLETLSTGNASGKAARVIQIMPANMVDASVIKRGLLLCLFDAYNPNAFENATMVFDAMRKKMSAPEAKCMKLFLKIAENDRKFEDKLKYPTLVSSKLAYARQMFDALDRVWEPLRLATNHLAFSGAATSSKSPEDSWKRTYGDRQELLEVARRFVALSDKILSQELLPIGSDDSRVTIIRRKVMNDHVFRMYEKQSELNKTSVEGKDDYSLAAAASY
ncbi:hypothetical protein VMCG_00368 [Cytospora schulzeri]|uniref:Pentacotripeptide-repeat region of PRORP domain-containing protein n=1 Tax=Cytospora schulzeri TaxID=448051 RepID=A0A423X974_9PEZI|nr:hypothetical protein VMCG_00368 [Valsa malicola]